MINETASVIGYALNAEKAGAVGRRGMAREVIDQTRKNIEGRGCVINECNIKIGGVARQKS